MCDFDRVHCRYHSVDTIKQFMMSTGGGVVSELHCSHSLQCEFLTTRIIRTLSVRVARRVVAGANSRVVQTTECSPQRSEGNSLSHGPLYQQWSMFLFSGACVEGQSGLRSDVVMEPFGLRSHKQSIHQNWSLILGSL